MTFQPADRRPQTQKLKQIKRHKNMEQMKEHGKYPQDQTNEEEIGSLPEKSFRVMIVRMIRDLGEKMEAQIKKIQEKTNKDQKELKNKRR